MVIPTEGNDKIYGYSGDDVLSGLGVNDMIDGQGGADTLSGGAGGDKLYGQDGNDWLSGGTEDDVLIGSEGNDFLYGGNNNDVLSGGKAMIFCMERRAMILTGSTLGSAGILSAITMPRAAEWMWSSLARG